jgi:hypothetical protein
MNSLIDIFSKLSICSTSFSNATSSKLTYLLPFSKPFPHSLAPTKILNFSLFFPLPVAYQLLQSYTRHLNSLCSTHAFPFLHITNLISHIVHYTITPHITITHSIITCATATSQLPSVTE